MLETNPENRPSLDSVVDVCKQMYQDQSDGAGGKVADEGKSGEGRGSRK